MFTSELSSIDRENFSEQSSSLLPHHSLQQQENNSNSVAIWSKAVGTVLTTATLAALIGPQNAFASDVTTSATNVAVGAGTFLDGLAQTGFYQAFSIVFLSEIGDKTFFIAGLLAMKTSK